MIAPIAAITCGFVAAFATVPLAAFLDLPEGSIFASADGFDTLDLALVGGFAGWLAGSTLAGALVAKRRHRRHRYVVAAAAALAAAAGTLTMVSSAAADWWFPFVLLAGPPLAMAMAIRHGRRPG